MEANINVLRVKPNCIQLAIPLATLLVTPTNNFHLQNLLTLLPLALSSFY